MRDAVMKGRIWILQDENKRLIEDIDTDQIYHNQFLHITDIEKMGQYALGNLKGWEDFSKRSKPGDIVLAGRNFGAGSSRQQAVDCFLALGVAMIIAPSFGAIYFRNAVNSGFPVLKCPQLAECVATQALITGHHIQMDVGKGEGINLTNNKTFPVDPMSSVQREIWEAGGLFQFAKKIKSRLS